jgi:cyclohexyl-isocyanide hydratase
VTAAAVAGILPFDALAADTASEGRPFEILFVLYPKFTLLDFAGANEVLARLPNVKVRVASPSGGAIRRIPTSSWVRPKSYPR